MLITFTAAAAPTAEPEPESAIAPAAARFCSAMGRVAVKVIPPPDVEVRVAPVPVVASVVRLTTFTPTEPATPTCVLPPAAARLHVTNAFVLPAGVSACTETPCPVARLLEPTEA